MNSEIIGLLSHIYFSFPIEGENRICSENCRGGYLNRLLPKVTQSCLIVFGLLCITSPVLSNADDTGSGTTDVTIQVDDSDDNIMWSAPTQIPFKATAAGTLIGPEPDAIAIRNLSAFPIRVKTMYIVAQDPFHLVDDVDQSTSDNDIQMTWNGVKAKSQVELADDGTWAMGYAGNKDGTDELALTYSDSKIARVTADLSAAQKAATISWTVEPTTTIKPEPKPDQNGVAFAVYSQDDNSLDLYKRDREPAIGNTFNGKNVTRIYKIDEMNATKTPFNNGFKTVEVIDNGIKPVSTESWFQDCFTTTTMELSKLDTSRCTNMSNMFKECSGLTSIEFSCWDTSNVINMSHMFCDSAFENDFLPFDISSWNTFKVTDMSYMFANCAAYSQDSLDFSRWDTSNVTNMGSMFSNSTCFNSSISSWNTSSVINMRGMFYNNEGLDMDLSGWNTSNVTNMEDMFSYGDLNSDFKPKIDIKGLSHWDTSKVTDMVGMFRHLEINSLNLSGWKIAQANLYGIFEYSTIKNLDISGWDCKYYSSGNSLSSFLPKSLISLKANNIILYGNASYLLNSASNLVTIEGISSWNTSHITDMSYMFVNCSSLKQIDLSEWNVSNVTNMTSMFRNCSNLTTVGDLSCWDTSKVKYLGEYDGFSNRYLGMFDSCTQLKYVGNISNWNISQVKTNKSYVFRNCPLLSNKPSWAE